MTMSAPVSTTVRAGGALDVGTKGENSMKILALDAATKTGWCILKNGKIFESGTQDFSKKRGESNGAVFFRFRNWLNSILGTGIDFVTYEMAHHRGGSATEICVNLTGRIQEACAERDMEFTAIHSATLKKWATGRGNADKADMMKVAAEHLGRQPIDDNEADAVLLALMTNEEYGDRVNHTDVPGVKVRRGVEEA